MTDAIRYTEVFTKMLRGLATTEQIAALRTWLSTDDGRRSAPIVRLPLRGMCVPFGIPSGTRALEATEDGIRGLGDTDDDIVSQRLIAWSETVGARPRMSDPGVELLARVEVIEARVETIITALRWVRVELLSMSSPTSHGLPIRVSCWAGPIMRWLTEPPTLTCGCVGHLPVVDIARAGDGPGGVT